MKLPYGSPEKINQDKDHRNQVALFRYGVIADLIHLAVGTRGMYALLREKAEREWTIPFSHRQRVSQETIRGWLADYRKGGFDALLPKQRDDIGKPRVLTTAIVDLLCDTKEKHPDHSIAMVINLVTATGVVPEGCTLAPSTVHRLLSRAGLMAKPKDTPTDKDRRRFAYETAGELWMSDVMHGPSVTVFGKKRKAYLIAIIDDATRLIPYAAFCLSETCPSFLAVLHQGMERRGIPKRLYVDNGAAFRAHHLTLVCAKLGVTLIHARPYSPQGKGKMERWFRTVRMSFLPTLAPTDNTLDRLNQRLWAWVEGEYHQRPHQGLLEETPADRWAQSCDSLRFLPEGSDDLFLFEQRRRVQADRTISLDGVAFEVDAALVGETVLLRYDPARAPDKRAVQVWHKNKYVHTAKRVDTYANCFVKRDHSTKTLRPDTQQPLASASEPLAPTAADRPSLITRLSDFHPADAPGADDDTHTHESTVGPLDDEDDGANTHNGKELF